MRLMILILLCFAFIVPAAAAEVRVGVLAYRGAERAEQDWLGTLAHLNASLPQHRFVAVPLDLPGLTQAVEARQVDFIITNPGHYVELESLFHATRIATVESVPGPSPGMAIGSAVLVRADAPGLRDLADLRGKRLAAVAPDAFGGFRVVWRELLGLNLDPFTQMDTRFLGFPMEGIVAAVRDGQADAGILRVCLYEQLVGEGQLNPEHFRILSARHVPESPCLTSTRLYPDWPFARLDSTAPALAKQVGMALLSMPMTDGQGWTVPVDYQTVHELFRDLKIGPYEHLARRSFTETLRDNWPWLMLAALGILWWVVHVARVEYLVRSRTDELRRAHESARRQRDEMEHAARLALMGEMASSLAHEINQPLAAIANYARGCQRRLADGSDPDGVAEGVGLIATQADRAADIVKRMRSFVRKRLPEPQSIAINDVIRDSLGLFQVLAGRAGVDITLSLADGLPMVTADRVQLEQVLLNLMKNAADALAHRDNRLISVTSKSAVGGLEVVVADNGPGLPPDALAHLFDPFFTTKKDGLGLGLSLSRSIIEAHGGHLWGENRPEGGARFHFLLPHAEGPKP
ncbi:MAG: PhnD/SsuA/transferrin family substrate-binding protein [Magnetospirillum gryphiswaldense]|nr:PhnD/SsuA/transferrin family substrate-binding protein [Magnetospirillum gryphiswaldense]